MPNLLGGYDCGDEPEEEDDSVKDYQSGTSESGESENDEPDSPAVNHQHDKKNDMEEIGIN